MVTKKRMVPSPRVSVIIPTFNRSYYLSQAVSSVLGQTFTDFEILVVDDGSEDDTGKVVKDFADSRIKYIRQKNSGRSTARNRGFRYAHGEFIAFLDDDDRYLPQKLSRQVEYLTEQQHVDVVVSDSRIIDDFGNVIGAWHRWEQQPVLDLNACILSCPISTCAILIRREVLSKLDHWFDTELDRAEDTDFYLRLMAAGTVFEWLPEILSERRMHSVDSQQSGAGYQSAYHKMIDKLYAQPQLPLIVASPKEEVYAEYLLTSTFYAIQNGQNRLAVDYLRRAIDYNPEIVLGSFPDLTFRLASFAQSRWVTDPIGFIENFFQIIPSEDLENRTDLQKQALSALSMERVFSAKRKHQPMRLGDWVRGIWYNPRWLTNIGVWSIALNSAWLRMTGIRD